MFYHKYTNIPISSQCAYILFPFVFLNFLRDGRGCFFIFLFVAFSREDVVQNGKLVPAVCLLK